MTESEKAAYIVSQSVAALIEALGMAAENSQHPEDQPYGEQAFIDLISRSGLWHNDVMGWLQNG